MEIKDLKVGDYYSYATSSTTFKLIGVYQDHLWVEWVEDREIETFPVDKSDIELIKPINATK